MTGIRHKGKGKKLAAFMAAAAVMIAISSWLSPCSGMEAMTQEELAQMSGRVGLSIAFGSTVTVKATFNSLNFGDPDGWGNSQDDNPGWLVLIGTGTNTGTLSVTIPEKTKSKLDVCTTGATACSPAPGVAPYAGIIIPANTTYIAFSLTNTDIGLQDPTTVEVYLGPSAGTPSIGQGDRIGWMRNENLMIDKADKESTLYLWAH